jgi:hypothetical protein
MVRFSSRFLFGATAMKLRIVSLHGVFFAAMILRNGSGANNPASPVTACPSNIPEAAKIDVQLRRGGPAQRCDQYPLPTLIRIHKSIGMQLNREVS